MIALAFLSVPALAESPLSSGIPFPPLEGKSLLGANVTIKADGKTANVFVLSFSNDAYKAATAWIDGCRANVPPPVSSAASPKPQRAVVCYDVRFMQNLPRVMRRFMEGRTRGGIPATRHGQTILVYKNEEDWSDRLTVIYDQKDQPYVVFVAADGRVSALTHGPYDAALFAKESAEIAKR